ncbi:MAG: CoA-binding protein [Chloroflexota bacterium]|nr:CoA-binding protein [Chloroflexota bacterium]
MDSTVESSGDIVAELTPLFYPRAVAVVGASNREGNFGRMFAQGYIEMGFQRLYIVHPTEREVLGIKAYPSVAAVPDAIDVAVVVSPLGTVPGVVAECTDKGVRGVVIFTSGFGELGGEGKALEQELVAVARRGTTRVIGPNCMGIYCPASGSTIFSGLPRESGPVGMIAHSGSLSIMLTMAAAASGIRFSKVVSCGNECDLSAADFLEYLGKDPDTRIIVAYLETIRDGGRFLRLAREISREKPIIVWRGGTTARGARAAASHTGAIAVPQRIWGAAVAQAGIVGATSAEDVLDCLQAFYYLPRPHGNRVAIISGPGGPAVATSDACIEAGLELAELSPHTRERLAQFVPAVGTSLDNPIDLGMGSGFFPQWYTDSIAVLADEEAVDMLLVIGGSWDPRFGRLVLDAVGRTGKPAAMATMPGRGTGPAPQLPAPGLAVYPDGRRAAMALGRLARYSRYSTQD